MNKPPNKCKHGNVVCSMCVEITDAARRMADQVNAQITFRNSWDLRNCYMAFRLEDGSTDGVLYDSKQDAMRFTDEQYHAYFCFRQGIGGISPLDCQVFLDVHRWAYENGMRLNDPDLRHSPEIIVSNRGYDIMTGRMSPN
jgi:hypothetical protein